jgi:hydroxymethylpyrimidine/phosphomethylpyrimidine kinase
MIPRVLAIAGSDSGGGAGIQADIKTITMLGGHAMTAVTALTAQNTVGVSAILPVPADLVVAQIEAVLADIGVDAIKIGMIGSAETAAAVANYLADRQRTGPTVPIIFDPVMVATSGAVLAGPAERATFDRLMALAELVTPNLAEAALLGPVAEGEDPVPPMADLARRSGARLLLKGGHGIGATVIDQLIDAGGVVQSWSAPRIDTRHDHGTGCTLSSAIACGRAAGLDLPAAIERGRRYVRAALAAAPGLGNGHGPMGHGLGQAFA